MTETVSTKPGSASTSTTCSFPQLTSEEDIQQLLADTDLEIAQLDARLEQAQARSDVPFQLNTIMGARTKIAPMLGSVKELSERVDSVATLADNVGAHVRTLDVAQGRCEAVLARVSDILGVKDCIDGIQLSMLEQKYEEAAKYVQAFMAIDQSAADAASCEVLKAEAQKLFVKLSAQLNDCAQANDFAGVKRFVKLLAGMGRQEEAATQLFEFLEATVHREATQDFDQMKVAAMGANAATDAGVYVSPLARLFAMVATVCRRNEKFVREHLEVSQNLVLLRRLHSCAEQHALQILQELRVGRHLEVVVGKVEARGPEPREQLEGVEEERQAVDGLLDELMGVLCRCEQYSRFVQDRASKGMIDSNRARSDSLSSHTGLRPNSELQMAVAQLAVQYITLESHFMTESVAMAIDLDEASVTGSASSMVEDAFFVLRRSGERAVATSSIQVMQAVVLNINNVLSTTLKPALEAYIQNKSAQVERAKVADAFSLTSEVQDLTPALKELAKNAAYIALNNMEVSAEYARRLRQTIQAQLEEGFGQLAPETAELRREQLAPLLADLSELASEFEDTAGQGQEELWGSQQGKLAAALDGVGKCKFELSEAEHSANRGDNAWVQRVLEVMQGLVQGFKAKLTPNNAEGVAQKMVLFVVERVEQLLKTRRFNQLGGLQLDRDTRTLREFLKTVTTTSVRDKFTRLTQIANILSVERPQELTQYWGGDGKAGWILSRSEMVAVLKLRAEFKASEIEQVAKELS
eukprot:TRINITY_DN16812_c0_g1_i4.p1 TRINITY_DN16812_c0_g1~~TRINITY_DN16812_c0_g1_i4.p1  ORF type:complete len:754 (-),score=278.02 TRINITY_DN16812_c0_g1_i4:85-2346(-)